MRTAVVIALGLLGLLVQPAFAHAQPGVTFSAKARDRVVITTPTYRVALAKRNGTILEIFDRAAGVPVSRTSPGSCLWVGNAPSVPGPYRSGCLYSARNFVYRWSSATSTLTMKWTSAVGADHRVDATVKLTASDPSALDLQMTLVNRGGGTIESVQFPSGLVEDIKRVTAGFAPTYLPGVRLQPEFFSGKGATFTYPSRWAFADYLAVDMSGGQLAVYSVNPTPSPIHPAEIGFVHASYGCSGLLFCLSHSFLTWIRDGDTWSSPTVRIRVGKTVEQSIGDYRVDNEIDRYPSFADKVGSQLATFVRAPLIKADLPKILLPFREWGPDLTRLPKPSLIHPVSFEPGGHDATYPDILPPDPFWGTTADLRAVVEQAHELGSLVMPFTNPTFWTPTSPTVVGLDSLEPPVEFTDLAVQDVLGKAVLEHYGEHPGFVVSPFPTFVRDLIEKEMEEWRTEVAPDCIFIDQIGARVWLRDFNPASPTPLAYADGWLEIADKYADRCLMVEDGWDRVAQSFVGFHGGLLEGDRADNSPNLAYGVGNWDPYPIALWLLHDKVLLYQHALYDFTMTDEPVVLRWNVAFGMMFTYTWTASNLDSPWLDVVKTFQPALGPLYAGRPLTKYSEPAPDVTETVFGDLEILATWNAFDSYERDGYTIAPDGFLARTEDGTVLAGAFTGSFNGAPLSPGTHYVLVERDDTGITVRQPLGDDTTLAIALPTTWAADRSVRAVAFDAEGQELGEAAGVVQGGSFELPYAATLADRPVAYYRLSQVE